MYSYSKLTKGDRFIQVWSIFRPGNFSAYIVELRVYKNGKFRVCRQWPTSTISRNEEKHSAIVISLADRGWGIETSNVF